MKYIFAIISPVVISENKTELGRTVEKLKDNNRIGKEEPINKLLTWSLIMMMMMMITSILYVVSAPLSVIICSLLTNIQPRTLHRAKQPLKENVSG